MDEFTVSIPVPNDNRVTNRVTNPLSENQLKILQVLSENPKISIAQIAEAIGISSRKVKENIAKLKRSWICRANRDDKRLVVDC